MAGLVQGLGVGEMESVKGGWCKHPEDAEGEKEKHTY